MMTKTTVIKKTVCFENKRYRLSYCLVKKDDIHYGIKVNCKYQNIIETEQIWVGNSYRDAMRLLYLFATETVFPVALKETWENL